jgi:ribonuclease R
MLVARLFAGRIGERFQGHVVGVKPFGLIVQLAGQGVTGTVSGRSLPEGPYRVDATEAFVSESRRFVVGASLLVEVVGADEAAGRLELELVDE